LAKSDSFFVLRWTCGLTLRESFRRWRKRPWMRLFAASEGGISELSPAGRAEEGEPSVQEGRGVDGARDLFPWLLLGTLA
ncbi:MAG: hypothetical protein SGPRY_006410, partial [Prymnesium sp.]